SHTYNTSSIHSCTSDSTCSSYFPYLGICNSTANNPNPGGVFTNGGIFGPNGQCRAIEWATQCAPSLGATKAGPGASCTHNADCQTGHCLVDSTLGKSYCFGACTGDSDCTSGTH